MNKIITVYELLGLIKDKTNYELYIKYFDKIANKEQVMWACEENIFDKLDNKGIFLNDKVKILEEDRPIIEKIHLGREALKSNEVPRAIDYVLEGRINKIIDYLNKKESK